METCDKCGRILYLIDIEVIKSGNRKSLLPYVNKIFMCPRCETTKTKGL